LGTVDELKKTFGVGYYLTFVKADNKPGTPISLFLQNFFQNKFKDIKQIDEQDKQVTYLLPYSLVDDLHQFFSSLDSSIGNLKISSYGLQITTLEEVYLKLTHEQDNSGNNDDTSTVI